MNSLNVKNFLFSLSLQYNIKRRVKMKNNLFTATLLVLLATLVSCNTLNNSVNSKMYTVNGVIFRMIEVKGGSFSMGSAEGAADAEKDEYPVHKVTVDNFYMAETEVTQELWVAVMGSNPSGYTDDAQLPVESVTWFDCLDFIEKLNELTGATFRLPTEAEWEYAARGGQRSKGFLYSGSDTLANVGWYKDNAEERTQKVMQLAPNELGLYDMSGNVWEWCSDWQGDYTADAVVNPQGAQEGRLRVMRGGSWLVDAALCRSVDRCSGAPRGGGCIVGLRLAM